MVEQTAHIRWVIGPSPIAANFSFQTGGRTPPVIHRFLYIKNFSERGDSNPRHPVPKTGGLASGLPSVIKFYHNNGKISFIQEPHENGLFNETYFDHTVCYMPVCRIPLFHY